jgi:hypothetical protein
VPGLQIMSALTNNGTEEASVPPEVQSSWAYGYSLFLRMTMEFGNDTNAAGAFMWVNGGGDILSTIEAEQDTFSRLQPPRAYAVLSGLDHFSIADRYWQALPRDGEINSTLSRQEQTALVTKSLQAWLRTPHGLQSGTSLCSELRTRYVPGALETCEEDL